jgi:lambda family phage portal protein
MSGHVQIVDASGHPIRAQDTAHFAASRRAREFARWAPLNASADAALLDEVDTIAARANDLERNNAIAAGGIRTGVDNIVGSGLRLAAKPDYRALGRTKEWADDWAKNVEARWRTFADTPEFDAARQLTFGGMTAMQLRTTFVSGEALALALWLTEKDRAGARWRTCLQAVDPARLATPDGQRDGASMRGGIEISPFGEPLAYWIRKSHPCEVGTVFGPRDGFERVEARTSFGRRKVVHLYEKLRPGQSRGRSILTSVMGSFRMLDHYQRIELQTSVVNSMIAAFIETPLSGEQIAQMFGENDGDWQSTQFGQSRNGWDVKLEGAGIIPLHPGDKLSPFTPNRPSTAYASFVEAVLRTIGTGINMPYELLMRDFSKTNYSSARAALLEAWRYFMSMREWLSTYWCDPVYELWLEEAISKGEVEAPGFYENRAAYCRCKWIGPGRGWIDPLREAEAAKVRLESGISTLERESAEQGEDWEEVIEQRARENETARSLGLPDVHIPPAQGGSPDQAGGGRRGQADDELGDEEQQNGSRP